jgi:hypothetical protein
MAILLVRRDPNRLHFLGIWGIVVLGNVDGSGILTINSGKCGYKLRWSTTVEESVVQLR